MHNIYTLNKFKKDELSARETQAVDKLREDAGLGQAKSLMPTYKNDIDAVFSQALMRRLGAASVATPEYGELRRKMADCCLSR